MSKLVKQTEHDTRIGHKLYFDNGHIWSLVDLTSGWADEGGELIKRLYPVYHYEAMPVAPEEFIFTQQLRCDSMENLIEAVKDWEAHDHA